ncbi:MAG: hypothetical protein NTX19_01030 [Gemmatimonadetes bacterium]|nr:hypothetical protein [Gemmatimonadota bacterium]
MSQPVRTNLAETPFRTSAMIDSPAAPRSHGIDRVTAWVAAIAGGFIVLLVWVARDLLGQLLTSGEFWILRMLALALSALVASLTVRLIVSPRIGRQIGNLADVAEAVVTGDLSRKSEAIHEGGQLERLGGGRVRRNDVAKAGDGERDRGHVSGLEPRVLRSADELVSDDAEGKRRQQQKRRVSHAVLKQRQFCFSHGTHE